MTRDELIGEVVTCMAKRGYSLAPWPPKSTPWREQLVDAWRSLLADAALGLVVRKAHDEYVKHHRVYVFASEIHAALAAEQQPVTESVTNDDCDKQPCGHSRSAIMFSGDGTNYCGECAHAVQEDNDA